MWRRHDEYRRIMVKLRNTSLFLVLALSLFLMLVADTVTGSTKKQATSLKHAALHEGMKASSKGESVLDNHINLSRQSRKQESIDDLPNSANTEDDFSTSRMQKEFSRKRNSIEEDSLLEEGKSVLEIKESDLLPFDDKAAESLDDKEVNRRRRLRNTKMKPLVDADEQSKRKLDLQQKETTATKNKMEATRADLLDKDSDEALPVLRRVFSSADELDSTKKKNARTNMASKSGSVDDVDEIESNEPLPSIEDDDAKAIDDPDLIAKAKATTPTTASTTASQTSATTSSTASTLSLSSQTTLSTTTTSSLLSSTSSISDSTRSMRPSSTLSSQSSATAAPISPIKYVEIQDPLPVHDSTYQHLNLIADDSKFKAILNSDLLSAAPKDPHIHLNLQQEEQPQSKPPSHSWNRWNRPGDHGLGNQHVVIQQTIVNDRGEPFLFTGSEKARTQRNCYIVSLDLEGEVDDIVRQIEELIAIFDGNIKDRYDTRELRGFSVCFPEGELPITLLRAISGIRYVERDMYSVNSQIQENAPWQLARIKNSKSKNTGPYEFKGTGKDVTVYVIDSGVLTSHPEFGGRATVGFTIFDSFPKDCSGHGTQVASLIAGTNVGVAKLANIVCAQILDCSGQGENSSVMAALNWIIARFKAPSVINMSVGGPKSISVDNAVQKAVGLGIPVVVAAGNSNLDACMLSPSGSSASLTVGASTSANKKAPFSNYGSCVDVFAPGRHIIAASLPSQSVGNGFTFVSGTSLSAPIVTGIYATYLEAFPNATPDDLRKALLDSSFKDVLDTSTLYGSPNRLAQALAVGGENDGTIEFLPAGSLPVLGVTSESNAVLEIILIAISGALAVIVAGLIVVVLVKRRNRKREERAVEKIPSVFR